MCQTTYRVKHETTATPCYYLSFKYFLVHGEPKIQGGMIYG